MDLTRLDMLLLNLIKHTTGTVAAEFNQNRFTQLVKLNMMNVKILIHVPNPYRYIGKVKLQELDVLLRASHTTGEASTNTQHHDPVAEIQVIYDRLEKARAPAGQPELYQNLIQEIERLIIEFHGRHQVPNPLLHDQPGFNKDLNKPNNDEEHIVNFESAPTSAQYSYLNLVNDVKKILQEMDRVLGLPNVSGSNQKELMDKLTEMTRRLIDQISEVQDHINCINCIDWEQAMKSDAAIKTEPYIDGMDSLKEMCNQVAAMYWHSPKTIPPSDRRIDETYTWCGSFHEDIFNGNHHAVDTFLKENPLALTTRITVDGNTALHVAVKAEKLTIVHRLLENLSQLERLEFLEKRNKEGKTALYIAAASGNRTIAEELVRTNKRILLDECEKGTNHMLPLFVAAKYDKQDMVRYIYEEMRPYRRENAHFPQENPNDQKGKARTRQWTLFLVNLIYNDHYDMASPVIDDYPHLALYKYTDVETPLFALAQRPSLGANKTFNDKASKFSCPNGNKMEDGTDSKASELLKKIILSIQDLESHKPALSAAFFKAAEVGNVGFIFKFIESHRAALNWLNDHHQNIFHVAIINRQENIFNLIYRLTNSEKSELTGSADKSNNWMLHLAGEIAPANRLNQVPGPAMQLQRELQWFQAVKNIVPNISTDVKNLDKDKTPYELFDKSHENLMEHGVDWMRNTASQCSIVAALITTVMFAAAFTLPGGNDPKTGDPVFLGDTSFLLFAAADLVALSTSCTSVLIFLSILTSRFAQEDFLISLPMRLIWGLVLLFVSMAAMTIAFCDTIYIIVHRRYHPFSIPVIALVGFIPVFTFSRMMFPLLIILWKGTKFSIFDKSSGYMYY